MPGIGNEAQGGVQAGLSAQPLVTTGPGVVTPSAVEQLVNSFRSGAITADDIIQRIGPVGQAKKKAELQSLGEFNSPEGIEARKQALQTSIAQGQLSQQQAEAGQQLLPAQTDLTAQQLAMNARFMYPQAVMGLIQDRLKSAKTVESVDPQTGAKYSKDFNSIGEEITPGSPAHSTYSKLASQVWNLAPGSAAVPTQSPQSQPDVSPLPAPPQTGVTPDQGNAARAALIEHPAFQGVPGSAVAAMSDADATDALAKANSIVTPRTAPPTAAKPEIYVPGKGIQTSMPAAFQSPQEIGTDLRKQAAYDLWDKQQSYANSFRKTAGEIEQVPVKEQRSGKAKMNQLDLSLAENIIKMYDPGNAIREFKWDKLAEGQPLWEKLKNFKAEFQRTGTLTPESRQRLINLGNDTLAASDSAVRPHVQLAAQRAKNLGLPVENVLNPNELRVLNSQSTVPSGGGATPAGKQVTIPGLGTGVFDPSTGLFTRTQ
jgi:hypothetical protein